MKTKILADFQICMSVPLRLTYSGHYIKERKTNKIFLVRMKRRFIKSFSSEDIFNGCIKNLCFSVRINRTISK